MTMNDLCYDVILRNGTLIDGRNHPAFRADVAIHGGRLAHVGDLGNAKAHREIDVSNLVVAPGFIDVHTHDDAAVIESPQMAPKLTQGVTTVIAGNCGISAAPFSPAGARHGVMHLVFKSERCLADTLGAYIEKVRSAEPAVNVGLLTGHTTLRMQVMGQDLNRPATADEIAQMRDLLAGCLEEGSLGFSTGLFYPSARAASTEEVIEIAAPLRSHQGLYVTHMRDEADGVMESLQEALHIGKAVDVPVIISHHKCLGRNNFGRSIETLALLSQARPDRCVGLDVYPYTASSTVLNQEMVFRSERTLITWCDRFPEYTGVDLAEVAGKMKCSIEEAVEKLQPAGAVYFSMDDQDITRILRFPGTMIGSDGLPGDQHPHPRLWGTFPRVLARYVRERAVLTLEEAIYRMTGLPAFHFRLQDRGSIEVGKYADLCVFDPSTIVDCATYEEPVSPSKGIHFVFVNGRIAMDNCNLTPVRAGRVLRRAIHGNGVLL